MTLGIPASVTPAPLWDSGKVYVPSRNECTRATDSTRTDHQAPISARHARSLLALVAALRGDMPTSATHADALERDIAIPR
jgi:hypothetical protein